MKPSRCPLLGYNPRKLVMEGRSLGAWFFDVESQPEVGPEAYDKGAKMLHDFFKKELPQFLVDDLSPKGREIIECCLNGGSVSDYASLLDLPTLDPA